MNKAQQSTLNHQLRILHTNLSVVHAQFEEQINAIYIRYSQFKDLTYLEKQVYRDRMIEQLNHLTQFMDINLKKVLVPQWTNQLIEMVRDYWYFPGLSFNITGLGGSPADLHYFLKLYIQDIQQYLTALNVAIETNDTEFALMQYANLHFLQVMPEKKRTYSISGRAVPAIA